MYKLYTFGKEKPIFKEKLHNELIEQYEEIAPYEKNKITGEILNITTKKLFRKTEPLNIYELIQSEAPEADLLTRIKKISNPAELNKEQGIYLDTTIYGNIHEMHEKTLKMENELKKAEKTYAEQQKKLKEQQLKEQTIKEYLKTKQKEKEANNEH